MGKFYVTKIPTIISIIRRFFGLYRLYKFVKLLRINSKNWYKNNCALRYYLSPISLSWYNNYLIKSTVVLPTDIKTVNLRMQKL